MVLPLLVAMISIAAVAAGVVGGLLLSRRHADAVHRQVEADRDLAIAAAVESVLAERRATVEAVAAERDTTVQKVVETAISVADAKLGDRADASARELDLRSKGFATQVEGINGELHRLGQLVGSLQRERAHQHGQLVEQLQAAATTTQRLTETTQGLRQALASPKARGQWGERMAADVLRSVGLVEGVNYRQQTAIDGGSIPDFTFLLPDGLELNMDVKFPIDNYLRFLDTQGTAEADIARTAFARDVRNRVKEITDRGYIDPEKTVDYVLLFIPNESVYAFLHENDADLVEVALRQRVVLCSPFTLFAVLGVIREAMDSFVFERTSNEILTCLAKFSKQWGMFGDHLDKVERQLDTVHNSFGELAGKRRRQLERELDRIDQLQVDAGGAVPMLDADRPALREVPAG